MPTTAEIEDALSGRYGPVRHRWRYEWRSADYTLLADIAGAVVAGYGTIKMDATAPICRTATMRVRPDAMPFDITDPSQTVAISLDVLIGGSFVTYPVILGHLSVGAITYNDAGETIADVRLDDLSAHALLKTTGAYTIATGTNVMAAAATILGLIGATYSLPAVAYTTPVVISTGPGKPYRWLLDRLMNVINYFPLVPDATGVFGTLSSVIPFAAPDVIYSGATEPRLLIPPADRPYDRTSFKNRAALQIDYPGRAAAVVVGVNNDPASNISVASTGDTITETLADGGYVYDTTVAQARVTYYLRQQHALANKMTIRTVLDPRRGVREMYRLYIPEAGEDGSDWMLLGWEMPMTAGGMMTHTIGRALPLAITLS